MAIWTEPVLTTTYVSWRTLLQERADSQAKMFDDGVTWTGLPTGTVRWNNSNDRFEKWNGSAWANLSTSLTGVLKTANNLSELTATAATARTNLGIGSIAVLNSPLPIANGGTGAINQGAAQTALGIGTLGLQAANSVAITGGSITSLTTFTIAAGTMSTSLTTVLVTSATNLTFAAAAANNIVFSIGGTSKIEVPASGTGGIFPTSNNTYSLGYASGYWSGVYSAKFYIQTKKHFQNSFAYTPTISIDPTAATNASNANLTLTLIAELANIGLVDFF